VLPLNQEIIDNDNFLGTGYSVHPLAAMFPLIEGDEFETLVRSIGKHGLKHPIILLGNAILDGRNRLRACIQAEPKREPRFEQYRGKEEEIFYFILQENVQRRHLDSDQRAAIVAQMQGWHLKHEAERLQREAQERGRETFKKGIVLKSVQSNSRAPRTIDKLAQLADISTYKAQQVITLLRDDSALLNEVAKGTVKLNEASKKSRQTAKPRPIDFHEQVKRATESVLRRAQSVTLKDRPAFISGVIGSLRKSAKEIT
jgi:ParB family chromosome partitioning protein